jgi:hypothetical protein
MLPDEFSHLKLIPAHKLRRGLNEIPPDPGVYLWFVRGGMSLLEQSSYFATPKSGDLLKIDAGVHLYTGAAHNLRYRISAHLQTTFADQSSPRKSLIALECRFGAVSKAVESIHDVVNDAGQTEWIFENVTIGIETNSDPFGREFQILQRYASPFNIAHRRTHRYSKWLMAWRAEAFPPAWMRELPGEGESPPRRGGAYSRRTSGVRRRPPEKRTPEEYREMMRLRRG